MLQVRLWDLRAQSRSSSRVVKTEGENINLAWSPDGNYLVVGNRDEVLSFIDARKGTVLLTKRSQTEVNEVKWSPSGMLIFLTMQGGKVRRTPPFLRLRTCLLPDDRLLLGLFDRADSVMAIVPQVDVLHWPNMKRLRKIYGHMDRCQCIDFDPRHPRFAVGGADALVSLWDLDELYCIRTFDRCETQVRAVSFSHDGLLLASASEDRFIDIAATETAKLVHRQPVRSPTNSISWHPNRPLLAYAGEDMDNDVSVHVFGFPV